MKKIVKIVLMAALLFPFISYSQNVKEGSIKVGKDEKTGFIATSDYSSSEVEAAIAQKLSAAGISNGKKKSKFYTYKEVAWPAISPNKIDLFYKVQTRKHRTTIYFVVSKGYDNYVTANSDGPASENINNFLREIDATIRHNQEVMRKETEIKAMNDKLEQQKADAQKTEDEKKQKAKELEDLKQKGQ